MTTESLFTTGMRYINTPLPEGYAKSIVNFNIKDDGNCLTPRGGLQPVTNKLASILYKTEYTDMCVHHAGMLLVNFEDESDTVLCNYMLYGYINADGLFALADAKLLIEYNGAILIADYDETASVSALPMRSCLRMKPSTSKMHGMDIEQPVHRSGIYASIEANTYVPAWIYDNNTCLGQIAVWLTNANSRIKWCVKTLTPKEIQPTQAINYGYNMLKDNPYEFINIVTQTGDVVLTGVIPYDDAGSLLLTARPGTPINFKLYYKYPAAEVTTEKYLIQWELQDLESSSDAQVIQSLRDSNLYTPGSDIVLTYTPTHKAFSLIAKFYKSSDITATDITTMSEADRRTLLTTTANTVAPTQVITLASYYLTSNSNSTMFNVSPVKYDLSTAIGMCHWQQRLVLWGVEKAKSTLFVSEVNTPEYIPYPNNSEIFTDNIICAVPYMTYLLVFTKSALYKLTMNEDGLSYSTTCVQERLSMIESDANTVLTVKNMVYFKSNNYFYMIVPNTSSLTGELQMAPVSRPIEYILDYFNTNVDKLVDDVYNIKHITYNNKIVIALADYHVYLDDSQIRNTYKLKINLLDETEKVFDTKYLDLSLNYDTILRAWTCYMWESTPYRTVIYKPTVTGKAIFAYIHREADQVYITTAQLVDDNPKDTVPLTDNAARLFSNYQLLDTGYRDHNTQYKKRFREIQFSVNMRDTKALKFYTSFTVDDDLRKDYYKYEVTHCTDKTSSDYGLMYVERVLVDALTTPGLTTLDDGWILDSSQFPELTVVKVRYKVNGKGYSGSVRILSTNETVFELLNTNWVYRVMFAR